MSLEPFLFATDGRLLSAACDVARPPHERAAAVVVDWELGGKAARQTRASRRIGTDTNIGTDTPEDLARVRGLVEIPVVCRINAPGPETAAEVDLAVDLGADEVLVPMLRRPEDLHDVVRFAAGRVGVGAMIETVDAVAAAGQFARLPITRAYVGLMDLALDRGSPSIFGALVDGTVERAREHFAVPFGFGGLTVPGRGAPVPTLLLLNEMSRLECDFTFLRRSFAADVAGADAATAIASIRDAALTADLRSPSAIADDRAQLVETVTKLEARVVEGRSA